MVSCQMILEYGLYISSPGWWHEGEYRLYISSPGWWHEDEFLLHLVGGMSGKLPNDIRVLVIHSSPGWWHEGEYGLYISSPGWWHKWQVAK
ncbi:hypothetical protein ACFX1W_022003 [Malus domestica]